MFDWVRYETQHNKRPAGKKGQISASWQTLQFGDSRMTANASANSSNKNVTKEWIEAISLGLQKRHM